MPDWLDPKVPTVASLLKGAGYATAHFGKWHLGHGDGAPPPQEYGFEVSKVVNGSGAQLGEEGKDPYFRAKSTAMIVDETIAFIKAHQDQPFYANVWTLLPHAKLNPTPEQLAVYANLEPSAGDPAFGPWMQKYLSGAKNLTSQMQVFCASLTDLDTQLGRLFAALDEMKLANDTVIFYSSDNGAEDYRIGNASNGGVGNTGPLRARKRSMYEGGIRTFGIVRWPGHVAAGNPEAVKSLTAKALAWAKSLPPSKARDDATATGKAQDNGRAPKGAAKPASSANVKPLDRAAIFKKWDKDHDGKLTFDEYKAGLGDKPDAEQRFKSFDTNHDGTLTEEEFVNAGKPAPSK